MKPIICKIEMEVTSNPQKGAGDTVSDPSMSQFNKSYKAIKSTGLEDTMKHAFTGTCLALEIFTALGMRWTYVQVPMFRSMPLTISQTTSPTTERSTISPHLGSTSHILQENAWAHIQTSRFHRTPKSNRSLSYQSQATNPSLLPPAMDHKCNTQTIIYER